VDGRANLTLVGYSDNQKENTVTTNTNSRYYVEKCETSPPCEHPLCHRLHRRFGYRVERHWDPVQEAYMDFAHYITRYFWVIMDRETGDRAFYGEQFDTKRDALRYLEARS